MYLKRIKNSFMNMRIKYKIIVSITSVAILMILTTSVLSYFYFSSIIESSAKHSMDSSLEVISNSFNQDIGSLYNDIAAFVSSDSMKDILNDIQKNDKSNFSYHYGDIQDNIYKIQKGNKFVDSLLVFGKNKEFYSYSEVGLKHISIYDSNWLNDDIAVKRSIAWLSSRTNTLVYSNKNVIPIIFPVTIDKGALTALPGQEVLAYVVVNLDERKLVKYLEDMNKTRNAIVYIAYNSGRPLHTVYEDGYSEVILDREFEKELRESGDRQIKFELNRGKESYYVMSNLTIIKNIRVVGIISKGLLLKQLETIKTYTVYLVLLSVLISIVISLLLAHTLTKPLNTLMKVIKNIENNDYSSGVNIRHEDEIGKLGKSINSMMNVINAQIARIKHEEKMKRDAEIAFLTEQINPHFLYNTLESIQWEILRGEQESAASLVENLGSLLRLSLNRGREVTIIEKEISHVKHYVEIMNARVNRKIELSATIKDGLEKYEIIKLILQPIVENSIKHGFDYCGQVYITPVIDVKVFRDASNVILRVEDNGKGFDSRQMQDLLAVDAGKSRKDGGIGLRNIIERLRLFYNGRVAVDFHSIPYYQNIVEIRIPFQEKLEDNQ